MIRAHERDGGDDVLVRLLAVLVIVVHPERDGMVAKHGLHLGDSFGYVACDRRCQCLDALNRLGAHFLTRPSAGESGVKPLAGESPESLHGTTCQKGTE